jgi:hypothetical protein
MNLHENSQVFAEKHTGCRISQGFAGKLAGTRRDLQELWIW